MLPKRHGCGDRGLDAGLTPARAAGHSRPAVRGRLLLPSGPSDGRGASSRAIVALPPGPGPHPLRSPRLRPLQSRAGAGTPPPLSPVARPWKPQGAQGARRRPDPLYPYLGGPWRRTAPLWPWRASGGGLPDVEEPTHPQSEEDEDGSRVLDEAQDGPEPWMPELAHQQDGADDGGRGNEEK